MKWDEKKDEKREERREGGREGIERREGENEERETSL